MIYYHGPADHDVSSSEASDLRGYQVTVGHHSVRVQARDPEQAIAAARTKLCDELPRLWDVIRALERARFQVRPV